MGTWVCPQVFLSGSLSNLWLTLWNSRSLAKFSKKKHGLGLLGEHPVFDPFIHCNFLPMQTLSLAPDLISFCRSGPQANKLSIPAYTRIMNYCLKWSDIISTVDLPQNHKNAQILKANPIFEPSFLLVLAQFHWVAWIVDTGWIMDSCCSRQNAGPTDCM